jgi:hypothetical protein
VWRVIRLNEIYGYENFYNFQSGFVFSIAFRFKFIRAEEVRNDEQNQNRAHQERFSD